MEVRELKGLCGGIVLQAVKDFKGQPQMREEVEAFLKSEWGTTLLAETGLTFDLIDSRLNVTEINKKHRQFVKGLVSLRSALRRSPTAKELARDIKWPEAEVLEHSIKYRFTLHEEVVNADAAVQ